jgi:hypothetical protein
MAVAAKAREAGTQMKRPKWFPWLECILLGACIPSLWQIIEISRSRLPDAATNGNLSLHIMILSGLTALSAVMRVASTCPRPAWLFPLFFVGFSGWIWVFFDVLSRLFSN